MKKVLAKVAEWFAIIGVLCTLVGFIFPPAGMYRFVGWSEKELKNIFDWDWLTLGDLLSSDGSALVIVALIVMVIALFATVYMAAVHKVSSKPFTGVILLGVVLVGVLCALFIHNELIANPTNHVYVNRLTDMKASIGVYIMGVAYVLQIVGALLAVGVSFMKSTPAEKAE